MTMRYINSHYITLHNIARILH